MKMTLSKKTLSAIVLGLATLGTTGCFPLIAGGVAGAALVISDRRTNDALEHDERIEWDMAKIINQDASLKNTHINTTSYNGIVLLTGEADTAKTRSAIEQKVAALPDVKRVINRIDIKPVSSLSERSEDTRITAVIKTAFLTQSPSEFSANHVKVVTESSVVYLMGIVTQKEADAAASIVKKRSGVEKIVTLFEIITPNEANRLDELGRNKSPARK